MMNVVQRTRDWAIGVILSGSVVWGASGADRPPSSDQPWPTSEPRQLDPDPAARPLKVTTTTAPAKTARTGPAGTNVARAGHTQPIGSGIRSTSQGAGYGRVRPAAGYAPVSGSVLRSGPSPDEVFENQPHEVVEGEIVSDDILAEASSPHDHQWIDEYDDGYHLDGECESCGFRHGRGHDCCLIPCPPWGSLQVFAGTQGFTGPLNVGGTGSFGFYEGLNYGSRLPWGIFPALGWQVGARFTQSDLSGTDLSSVSRQQSFLTAGLYRRVDHGLQVGVAFDLLHEDWYGEADLTQIRAELAWVYQCVTEYGVWIAAAGREKEPVTSAPLSPAVLAALNTEWQPTDLFAFYVRRYFGSCNAGQARLFFGGTGDQDGVLGADVLLPMTDHWAFQAGFTYLIPEESTGAGTNAGHAQESWNVTFGVTWMPGRANVKNYYRPLFTVADNGSFFVDRN